MAGTYKDLGVWREGIALLAEIHLLVKRLPEDERAHLGEQIFRAAVAVPSQIADGQELGDRARFLAHLNAANANLSELGSLLAVAEQLGHVSPAELEALEQARANVANPLRGLIEKVGRDAALLRSGDARSMS